MADQATGASLGTALEGAGAAGAAGASAGAAGGAAGASGASAAAGASGGAAAGSAGDGKGTDGAAAASAAAGGAKEGDKGAGEAGKGADGKAAEGAAKTLLEGAAEGEKKGEGEKKDDAADPALPEWAKEITKPEGVEWNDPAFNAVAPILAKHKVSKEAAQELVNAFAVEQSKQQAESIQALANARKEARAECEKTFKPEDYQAARRAIDRQCKDEHLRQFMLRELGDHPGFISMMAAFGRAISDDSTPGAAGSGGGTTPVRTEDKLWPRK